MEIIPLADFPGYGASSDGRIWSFKQSARYANAKNSVREMKYAISSGYLRVHLCIRNIRKHLLVHRLVASAFIPLIPGSNYVNHKDGNKLNNRADNLEWMTMTENINHSTVNRLNPFGARVGISKLSDDKVREIRKRRTAGETQTSLAKSFGVSQAQIWNIIKRRQWAHVT